MSVRTIWKNRPNLSPVVMLRANYVQARPQASPGPRNELSLACEPMLAHAQLVQTISSSWNFQATSSMCSARQKGGWVQDARLSPHPRWPRRKTTKTGGGNKRGRLKQPPLQSMTLNTQYQNTTNNTTPHNTQQNNQPTTTTTTTTDNNHHNTRTTQNNSTQHTQHTQTTHTNNTTPHNTQHTTNNNATHTNTTTQQ